MLCVLIVTPGRDTSFVVARLNELGYEVELYRAAPEEEMSYLLSDTNKREASSFIGSDSYTWGYPAKLRASFVKLLLDERYMDRNDVIFCEVDALPVCRADELERKLKEIEYPYDICKLHRTLEMWGTGYKYSLPSRVPVTSASIGWSSNDIRTNRDYYYYPTCDLHSCKFEPLDNLFVENNYKVHGHGCHAFYATREGRKKLARLFSETDCPVDGTIWWAAHKQLLNVVVPSFNLFIQSDQSHYPEDRHFLLGLYTELDFMNVQRQLYNIIDQQYRNFTLLVCAPSLLPGEVDKWLRPGFGDYIDNRQLIIIHNGNRHFLFNSPELVKDYELLIPLESSTADNDFHIYNNRFLSRINELHKHVQTNVGSWSDSDSALVMTKLVYEYVRKYYRSRETMLHYLDLPDIDNKSDEAIMYLFTRALLKQKGGVCRDNCYPILQPCLPKKI